MKLLQKILFIVLCAIQGVSPLLATDKPTLLDTIAHLGNKPTNTVFFDIWLLKGNFTQNVPQARQIIELSKDMHLTFCQLLQQLEKNQRYWQYYKTRTARYVFSRSPVQVVQSWRQGKNCQQEIEDNLLRIKMLIELLKSSICQLKDYLSTFDKQVNQEQKRLWLSGLMDAMNSISLSFTVSDDATLQAKKEYFQKISLVEQCNELKETFNTSKASLKSQVNLINKPNVIMRNWAKVLAGVVVVGTGSYYYAKNKNDVDTFVKDMCFDQKDGDGTVIPSKIKKHYQEYVETRVNDLRSSLRGDAIAQLEQNDKEIKETLESLKESSDNVKNILEYCGERFESSVKEKAPRIKAEQSWGEYLFKPSLLDDGEKIIYEAELTAKDISPALGDYLNDLTETILKLEPKSNVISEVLKSSDLNLRVIALFPAAGLSYLACKLLLKPYKYFTKKDLQSIRYDFKRVSDELNEHEQEDYGWLSYLLYRLRSSVERNVVSSATHMRADCLKDIAFLESRHVSTKQKKKKLEIMMNYYSFLSLAS